MPSFEEIKVLLMSDVILTITLGMSVLLAIISLFSGWRRLDFIAVWQPRVFMHIGLAILFAFMLRIFEQSSYANFELGFLATIHPLLGISFLPLFIISLAYGPSIGLFSVALLIAITPPYGSINWIDAVIMLEFVVLGWWAIYPSSFQKRWAASTNLIISYILVWGTAGTAYFHSQGLDIRDWKVHFNYHQNYLFSLLISVLFLLLIGPKLFNYLFPDSRIIPKTEPNTNADLSNIRALGSSNVIAEHRHLPLEKPSLTSLKRTDSRVRTMSSSPKRIAMRSFKDQDH